MSAAVLSGPAHALPHDHLVQAYTDDAFLARVAADYVGGGLAHGHAAVVIATPAHTRAFTERLAAGGIDVAAATEANGLLFLDAEPTLARLIVDGHPDRAAFQRVVDGALARVRAAGDRPVRLYGEMVDLLWEDRIEAALELEGLWNEVVVEDERLSVLCAYRIDALERHAQGVLRRVAHCHSRLMPADAPEHFEAAVDRAYTEVFGVMGEAAALRELMASRHASGVAVPAAHAALFALDDLPPLIADDIRARARRYYRDGARRESSRRG